jgi:hypothetical protein
MRRGEWERKAGYGPIAKAFRLRLLRNTLAPPRRRKHGSLYPAARAGWDEAAERDRRAVPFSE